MVVITYLIKTSNLEVDQHLKEKDREKEKKKERKKEKKKERKEKSLLKI